VRPSNRSASQLGGAGGDIDGIVTGVTAGAAFTREKSVVAVMFDGDSRRRARAKDSDVGGKTRGGAANHC